MYKESLRALFDALNPQKQSDLATFYINQNFVIPAEPANGFRQKNLERKIEYLQWIVAPFVWN